MFEELEEDNVDVTPDSPDRAIAWGIWSRSETSHLAPEEAWMILHQRYPADARFLLLGLYAELSEQKRETMSRIKVGEVVAAPKLEKVSAADFLTRVERVLAGAAEALHVPLRELVLYGGTILASVRGEEATRLAAIRETLRDQSAETEEEAPVSRDQRDRAGLRLRRFEREILKEIDERTADGKALGVAVAPPPPKDPKDEWAAATKDATRTRRTYAATDRYGRGELVVHPKFGVGLVTGTEPGKAVILFESGTRKLVAG